MSSSTVAHLILEEDDLSLGNLSFGECDDDGFFAGLGSTSLDSSSSSLQSLKPGGGVAPQSSSLMILSPAKSMGMMTTMSTAAVAPPRMVSVESMSQVTASPLKKTKPTTTHLQSLKDLVSKKQQRQPKEAKNNNNNKRSLFESRIASIFEKPSLVLQQVLEQQHSSSPQEEPVLKKRKIDTTLHEACRRPNVTVAEIEDLLVQDPTAAAVPATLMTHKRMYNPATCQLEDNPRTVPETYRYPLNLAIQYQASPAVLERLVAAAPQVLTTPDSHSISLHILIRHKPTDQTTADMMLLKQPTTMASWRDCRGNTALHQAVQHGAGMQMIRHLTILEPAALLQRNWHGQTPLDLAQRTGRVCSQDAADYLWNQTQEQF